MIGITRPDEKVSTLSFLTLMGLSEHVWTCNCLSSVSDTSLQPLSLMQSSHIISNMWIVHHTYGVWEEIEMCVYQIFNIMWENRSQYLTEWIKQPFESRLLSCKKVFEHFYCFKDDYTSLESGKQSVHPSLCRSNKVQQKVQCLVRADQRLTISEAVVGRQISFVPCWAILT